MTFCTFGLYSSKKETLYIEEGVKDTSINKYEDTRMVIIKNSQNSIKTLHEMCKWAKDTQYEEKFQKVLELSQKVHDKIVDDEKIPIIRLEQYHMYYTNEFMSFFEDSFDDLKPRKKTEAKLKADYLLEQTKMTEMSAKKLQELLNSISGMSILEKINHIISNTGHVITQSEIHDQRTSKGSSETFAKKYTDYIKDNWSVPSNNYIYVGFLNDKPHTPIMLEPRTLEVYKIIYAEKNAVRVGSIQDDEIKKLLNDEYKKQNPEFSFDDYLEFKRKESLNSKNLKKMPTGAEKIKNDSVKTSNTSQSFILE